MKNHNLHLGIFGSGCFGFTQSVFQEVIGVEKVISDYCGSLNIR